MKRRKDIKYNKKLIYKHNLYNTKKHKKSNLYFLPILIWIKIYSLFYLNKKISLFYKYFKLINPIIKSFNMK